VVIADDHAATRAGLRRALNGDGFSVCGEAADAEAAVREAERHGPDLCLLDVQMPGGGIAAAATIKARRPETTIVMLTEAENDVELLDAVRSGAAGYLLKEMAPDRLPDALKDACTGAPAIPRRLVGNLLEEMRRRPNGAHPRLPGRANTQLSRREWDVLELLRDGDGTGEIARRLSLSPVTVRRHLSSVVRKLEVPDRQAAVRLLEQVPDG
jgi:DNA-binding NarL/FixJ family response regulator